jgi:hypothetical protein
VAELVELTAELAVQSSQQLRHLEGAAYHTYMLPADDPLARELQKAKQEYHEQTARMDPRHRLGSPHVYIAMELLDSLRVLETTKLETLELLYRAWEGEPPGMPRVANFLKTMKIRLLPPANSQPHRRDRDHPAAAAAPGTPLLEAALPEDAFGDRERRNGLLEFAFNVLHRQSILLPSGQKAHGDDLVAQVHSEIEIGFKAHGATEETGPPPPSRKEKALSRFPSAP